MMSVTENPTKRSMLVPTKDGMGWWMRNAVVELLVSAQPRPRILVFRGHSGVSPLRRCPNSVAEGIRTWFMEPGQIATSRGPGEQPAQIRPLAKGGLEVVALPDPASALQLMWRLTLESDEPRLVLDHILTNHGAPRRIAVWAIIAVPARGTVWALRNPVARPVGQPAVVRWPGVAPDHPALCASGPAAGFRLDVPGMAAKIGVCTSDGEARFFGDGMALRSKVRRCESGDYPEGGGDVTFYHAGSAGGFGEIEHVGPLTDVGSGGTVLLRQQVSLESAYPAAGGID